MARPPNEKIWICPKCHLPTNYTGDSPLPCQYCEWNLMTSPYPDVDEVKIKIKKN